MRLVPFAQGQSGDASADVPAGSSINIRLATHPPPECPNGLAICAADFSRLGSRPHYFFRVHEPSASPLLRQLLFTAAATAAVVAARSKGFLGIARGRMRASWLRVRASQKFAHCISPGVPGSEQNSHIVSRSLCLVRHVPLALEGRQIARSCITKAGRLVPLTWLLP